MQPGGPGGGALWWAEKACCRQVKWSGAVPLACLHKLVSWCRLYFLPCGGHFRADCFDLCFICWLMTILLIWSCLHLFVLYSFHLLLSVYSCLGYLIPILLDFSIKTSCIDSEKEQEVYSFIVHLKDFSFAWFLLHHVWIVPLVTFTCIHCLYAPFVSCRCLIIGCRTFAFLSSI